MPASYTIRRSVPRNTRRSKPASTPSTCFPSFSINLFMAFPLPRGDLFPTQQTSYENRKRHHRLVAAMPRCDVRAETSGFKAATRKGVDLQVGAVARIDFTMEVGEVTQQME